MDSLAKKIYETEGPLRPLYNMPRTGGAVALGLCLLDGAALAIGGHSNREVFSVAEGGFAMYGASEIIGYFFRVTDYALTRLIPGDSVE
jgi:hypothetical protein